MAVAQHHDAVSGTAKQVVTYDYAERLSDGVNKCMEVVNHAYQKMMSPPTSTFQLPLQEFCPLVNISRCNATETSKSVRALVVCLYIWQSLLFSTTHCLYVWQSIVIGSLLHRLYIISVIHILVLLS